MFDFETLKLIWWLLLGILLIGFAVMDGFDLGVGMLLPFIGRSDTERRVIINTIGPVWEGNQVWLILGGGAIFAAEQNSAEFQADMKAAKAEIAKATTELEKRATDAEAATKLAGDALKKVLVERDALTKRVAELDVEVKRKGSLKAVPVAKGDDAPPAAAPAAAPVVGAPPHLSEAASLMKAVHAGGGTTPTFRNQ